MPDTPVTPDENQPSSSEPPEAPVSRVSRVPQSVERPASRFVAPAALLVAVVAVGLAIWSLSTASSGSSASGVKLSGDPKTRVCSAFELVSNAVSLQTNTNLGPDPVAASAVAGNARLALVGGGQWLISQVDSGNSDELAGAARDFGNTLQQIGIYALAGVPNTEPAQAGRMTQGDLVRKQIVDLCK